MKRILTFLFFVLTVISMSAQDARPEMADTLRSSGKIYVVVCVAAIVLCGLIVYLVTIDRKISRLEKEMASQKKQTP